MHAAYPTAPAVAFVSSISPAPANFASSLLVGGALTPSPTAVTGSIWAYPHAKRSGFDGLQLALPSLDDAAHDGPRSR